MAASIKGKFYNIVCTKKVYINTKTYTLFYNYKKSNVKDNVISLCKSYQTKL